MVILGLIIILICVYKKTISNKTLNAAIAIWSIITVSILIFRPIINRNTKIVVYKENLSPFLNELDTNEKFYLVSVNDKFYYKTKKLHTVNPNDSVIFMYHDTIKPNVIRSYEQNSNLWYALTLNKNNKLIKTELFLNYE